MTTKEMMNLYNVGKTVIFGANKGSMINIQKTYLTGYDLTMYVNNLRSNVYTFQYYPQSLEEIKDALKITLETKKPTPIKTFNFSVNDEYTPTIIGKKYYTVQRNETIPNFKGQSLQYVKSWCEARNITVYVNSITEGATGYDESLANDTVTAQSVARGKLVKDVSTITIDVIKKSNTTPITTVPEPTTEKTTIPGPTEGEDDTTTTSTTTKTIIEGE